MRLISMLKITYLRNHFIMKKLWCSKEIVEEYKNNYTKSCLRVLKELKVSYWYEADKEMRFITK